MKKFLSIAAGLAFLAVSDSFGTVWPSDGTEIGHNYLGGSVQWVHDNRAQDGDTITLPAGIFTWSTQMTITKAITLLGVGAGATIIRDNVQRGQLLTFSLKANMLSRLTGIEFQNGGRVNFAYAPQGVIRVNGSNINGSQFRMDHCKLDHLNGTYVTETVIGVIDHNDITASTGPNFYIYGSHWDGDTGSRGDKSWAAPTNFGSSQFLFFEDVTVNSSGASHGLTDGAWGARFVVRHCNINGTGGIKNHGNDTGRNQGCRAMEIYNNTVTGSVSRSFGTSRSGGTLFHHNTITGWGTNPAFSLHSYRTFHAFNPWAGADGTNPWDVNDIGNHSGNGFGGGPNGLFATGTASANTTGLTVTVSGNPGYAPNQWQNYTIRRISNLGGLSTDNTFSWITSNSANTITYSAAGGFGPNMAFTAGDTFEIRKVIQAMNQPGRAQGTLISGASPTPPPGGNNQVIEPCYSWLNTREGGAHVNFNGTDHVIREGEHFFNDTAMPGYTPFTYPHPLVTNSSPTPTATASPSPTPTPTVAPTPTATATATPTPESTQPPLVSNLVVASGRAYQWFDLASGQNMYIDRTYRFSSPTPASINGQFTLRTANDDKFSSANATHVSFTVNQASTVYVLYTTVNTTLWNTWLTDANGWSLENYTVPTNLPGAEAARKVRKKTFAAGATVTLRGNGSTNSISSMYNVVVVP